MMMMMMMMMMMIMMIFERYSETPITKLTAFNSVMFNIFISHYPEYKASN
jgi:hypothetical protein